MTPRQLAFVREYLRDENATQAMIRAGYSARSANRNAPKLMSHPQVRRLIEAAIADRDCAVRAEATAMLEEIAGIARSELLAARQNLITARRQLRSAQEKAFNVERLCAIPSRPSPPPRKPASVPELPPMRGRQDREQSVPEYPVQQAFCMNEYELFQD